VFTLSRSWHPSASSRYLVLPLLLGGAAAHGGMGRVHTLSLLAPFSVLSVPGAAPPTRRGGCARPPAQSIEPPRDGGYIG
jgi:hypothetical protein